MKMTIPDEITNTADVIDVRDVIARVEYLEGIVPDSDNDAGETNEAHEELAMLTELLDDLRSNGGDEQWKGDWYPITMIRDSYFVDYAQELAEDIGAINQAGAWPNDCIDWDKAAEQLQHEYSTVTFGGVDYWYR